MSDENLSFAVTVARNEGQWLVRSFNDDFSDIHTSINVVRSLRSAEAAFALLCVEDDYFVVVRPVPGGVRMVVSDATYAVEDDFAADFLELRDIDVPDIDPDDLEDAEAYGDGDFDIFADLGLSEDQLGFIIDNEEDWPSDMLLRIAGDLGFGDELEEIIAEITA
ncbi:tRNA adenosine deaminase-associated protein [Corynebacterium flavescens]|uniref:tRNA adenosine deaminase-associated protein n=1 Tax=Corynebacterium flavescens TaxID=28028 RepID=UPI003FD083F7